MLITGLLIAEHAETVDKKINIYGGILDTWGIHPESMTGQFELVILLQASIEDEGRDYELSIEVLDPDGEVLGRIDRTITADRGDGENRGIHQTIRTTFRRPGRHVFIVTADGTTATVPLTIHVDPSVSP
ncbi:hypothetical protein SEA_WOCKET_35 [Gordonia phage Wocket]|nr:hypothetical protein SEA_WOCKET_35 [Gordonia phage Wocket]